ncbi:MAG: TerC family protein [Thermomicrobiales bacterium]
MPEFGIASQILSIILIDLILSGDNAVVIGMAARRLSPENRRRAIIFGGGGAVVLRIIFTAMAALLLDVPYLQAAGGILLLYIALKLVRPQHHAEHVAEAGSLREAIKTIVLADVVMSLDNILAVGGAAHGNLWLLLFGLVLSIPILLFGSELVARLLGRFPILVYVGAFVLIWTAVAMILHDRLVGDRFHVTWWHEALATLVASAVIIGIGLVVQRRNTSSEAAAVARNERERVASRPWSRSGTGVESSVE